MRFAIRRRKEVCNYLINTMTFRGMEDGKTPLPQRGGNTLHLGCTDKVEAIESFCG